MRGRHQRGAGERGDIERTRVLAVHQVARPAQPREVGELLWCHDASVTAYPDIQVRCRSCLLRDAPGLRVDSAPNINDTFHVALMERADDRPMNHAAHHASGILDGFAAAELNVVRAEKHHAAAELANTENSCVFSAASNGDRHNAGTMILRLDDTDVSIVFRIAGKGKGTATFWTCDLTEDYIHINASYRT